MDEELKNREGEEAAEETDAKAEEETAETAEEKAENEENQAEDAVEDTVEDSESQKVAELTDRLQRLMAEFDNYRKRTEKEKATQYDLGVISFAEKILPVVDDFERGLASVPEEKREEPVYTGMDMIYKRLQKALAEKGIEPMNAEGKEFDPNLHNAVLQVENDELPENTVVTELQKGYTYKGMVVRHAMVSVNK